MVMSASADDVSVSGGKGFAILSLKRIYAMISVSVNTSGLKDRTIKPLKVSLHQVPFHVDEETRKTFLLGLGEDVIKEPIFYNDEELSNVAVQFRHFPVTRTSL